MSDKTNVDLDFNTFTTLLQLAVHYAMEARNPIQLNDRAKDVTYKYTRAEMAGLDLWQYATTGEMPHSAKLLTEETK